uniref:Putative ovule protein n=1 Tax=Solanum chacoense TaxID=4108 RepID=A0A0V0GIB2_SOLCH
MKIVSTRLQQRDLITLLLVNPSIHHTLLSHPSLWLVLDFHEMSNAGDRLVSALSLVCFLFFPVFHWIFVKLMDFIE